MMSSFNPLSRQLAPDEWRQIAHEAIEQSDSSHTVVMGGFLGLLAGAVVSPITGILVFSYFAHKAWKDSTETDRNDQAVETYGCVAHVLKGENLHDFAAQAGEVEACRQIQWAIDRGYRISPDAQEYLSFRKNALPPAEATSEDKAVAIALSPATAVTETTPASNLPASAQIESSEEAIAPPAVVSTATAIELAHRIPLVNLAQQIGVELKPTIFSAMPRVGKGMLVAYAWRYAKIAHPDLEVWVIDPKAHPSESGYWHGVDRIWRKPIDQYSVNDQTIASEIEAFVEAWRQSPTRPKLLIFDEQVLVKARLPHWYEGYVPSLMLTESSSGEPDRRYLWAITQSPLVGDMGLSGGNRSSFLFCAIGRPHTVAHLESAKKSGFVPSVPAAADYSASPVEVLAYYSARGNWIALPRYQAIDPVDESQLPHSVRPAATAEAIGVPNDAAQFLNRCLEADESEERVFTLENLTANQARDRVAELKSGGLNQTQIIWVLWKARKGGGVSYSTAVSQYKFLTGEEDSQC